MHCKKLDDLQLRASVDTLSIVTPTRSALSKEQARFIGKDLTAENRYTGEYSFHYKINPNYTDMGETLTYEAFSEALQAILCAMEIHEYHFTRVDFRIDSQQDNFDELLKLNTCTLLTMAVKYKVRNRYQSFDPLTLENLTIRIQNKYFEAENYNKGIQEPGGDIMNRLELRSLSLGKKSDIPSLIKGWHRRLNGLPDHFEDVQSLCNAALITRWKSERGKEVKTWSEFIRKYQGSIFSKQQLTELYAAVGSKSPECSASAFANRNEIEFFTHDDIERYLGMVRQALDNFLQNV